MEFRNKYDRKEIFTCPGNEIEEEWELQVNEKGIKEPVKVGEIDVHKEINSHRDSVDLNMLIARFNSGDYEALNRRVATYFDATEMPTTLAEAYRIAENGKTFFDKLNPDIKEKFNNDYGQFLAMYGTDAFVKAFEKPVVEKNADVAPMEVKNEQKSE